MIFVDMLTYLEGWNARAKARCWKAENDNSIEYTWLFRLSGACIISLDVLIEVVSPNLPTHRHIVSF